MECTKAKGGSLDHKKWTYKLRKDIRNKNNDLYLSKEKTPLNSEGTYIYRYMKKKKWSETSQ